MTLHNELAEYAHLAQQLGGDQKRGTKPAFIGYIASWNPKGFVTVQNMQGGGIDQNGNFLPLLTGEMPLGLLSIGTSDGINPINQDIKQWGIQYAPFGGATSREPTIGEQVLCMNVRNETGYQMTAFLLPNQSASGPGVNIPVLGVPLQNGEFLMVSPSGTTVHVDIAGNINIMVLQNNNAGAKAPGDADAKSNLRAISNGGIALQTGEPDTALPNPAQYNIDLTSHAQVNTASELDTNIIAQTDLNATATTGAVSTTAGTDINETATDSIIEKAGDIANIAAATLTQIAPVVTINGTASVIINTPQAFINSPLVTLGNGIVLPLCTSQFFNWVAGHTHPDGSGVTGPPNAVPPPIYPFLTETTQAS